MKSIGRTPVMLALLGLVAVWIFAGTVLFPRILAAMYAGKSFPLFNQMIAGRSMHPLDFYLVMVRYLFLFGLF